MGGAVFPPCSRGNGSNSNLLQKGLCKHAKPLKTVLVSTPNPVADHCWPMPPPETSGHSYASLAQSLERITVPFSWVLMLIRFCLCPPRVSVSPVLWNFCNQIPLTFKVKFPAGSQALCQVPRLGNLLWALELLPQCKNSFGIIILQFVGRLLHGCVVELMATFFKKTYATCCASQDCCSQSPCPHGKPLLIHTSTGDTQTPKTKSTQSVSGRGHCPGSKKCESAGTQYASKSGRLSSEHRSGKGPFFIPNPKKGNAIECSNYHTTALISQANKVMHKILQFGISLLFHVRF